ncbi:MAG: hypothetical protein KA712_13750 [Myxococcales bacterium]|nr:hypothetical protein [Myxococcales bacterium]
MTGRGTAVQGALAATALGVAFLLSRAGDSASLAEAIVIDARSSDLESLTYFDGKRHYRVEPDPAAGPGELRVHVSGGDRRVPVGMAPERVPDRTLRGGRLAKDLWAFFSPLRSMRALGKVSDERRQALGLTETKNRLTVKVRGVERKFRLAPPPPGAVEPYLLSEDDGRAYLVQRVVMNTFSERALGPAEVHDFPMTAYDRIALTPVGKPAVTLKSLRAEGTETHLSPEAELSVNLASLEDWHRALFTIPIEDALGPEELPASGPVNVRYRLEYWSGRDRMGWMDLAVASFRGGPRLYFRSERSLGWMVGPQGSAALLDQADKLFR